MSRIEAPRSFFFYDLETSGLDPRWDRVMQFAGLRTDASLAEVGEEFCSYVRLPIDVLPDPGACRVTGLTPQRVNAEGVGELEAFESIDRLLSVPGTCTVGFNNLRFDDEFLRFGFYRHFIDPYAREYRDGNTRWDVIDLLRATAALRPSGIEWPLQDGMPSFRLELFTAANGIDHGQAHDAMSDVRATVATASLLRKAQPRLFEFYLGLRDKQEVLSVMKPGRGQPCIHVSGRIARERCGLGVVLPVAVRPDNPNSVVVIDLCRDFSPFIDYSVEELRSLLFSSGDHPRPAIKEVRINRCPFVAPLSVLRGEDQERLGIDLDAALSQAPEIANDAALRQRLLDVFTRSFDDADADVDTALYSGFLSDADRDRGAALRESINSGTLGHERTAFSDQRLPELLFRLKARLDLPMSQADKDRWRIHVRNKLQSADTGLTLPAYRDAIAQLIEQGGNPTLVADLGAYGDFVEAWLNEVPVGE